MWPSRILDARRVAFGLFNLNFSCIILSFFFVRIFFFHIFFPNSSRHFEWQGAVEDAWIILCLFFSFLFELPFFLSFYHIPFLSFPYELSLLNCGSFFAFFVFGHILILVPYYNPLL